MTTEKTCSKCREAHSGSHYYCATCKREYDKLYKEKHRERLLAHGRDYAKKKYDKDPSVKQEYYLANREDCLARSKTWIGNNPEYQKTWVANNKGRVAAYGGKSSALSRSPNCLPDNFDFEATVRVYELRIAAEEETGIPHHVDHIVPLVFGGTHEYGNLQILPAHQHTVKTQGIDEIFRGLLD